MLAHALTFLALLPWAPAALAQGVMVHLPPGFATNAGDHDGDGRHDVLLAVPGDDSSPGSVTIHSSLTGQVLWT